MKKLLFISVLGAGIAAWAPIAIARETVVLPGVVGPTGVLSGVDTTGPGTLTVGAQNINTSNDAGGGITTDAANTANIVFNNSSTVTGFVGTVGSTFLDISAGTNGNTVTFNGPVYSTTFSLSGTGTVNFNGGFTSNTGSTMDFAGDGFINVGAGQTVVAAITNSAGAHTGTLTLHGNSILDGAVGAASGLKQINVVGGDALITGQVNSAAYTLGTNTLNVGGAFAIPVAGVINTTIFSTSDYGKIVPVGAATIGNALQINVIVTGPITVGNSFNIVDATSGTTGSTVVATDNSLRYLFSAPPTTNGLVRITTTQIPLAVIVGPVIDPNIPVIAPIVDALPVTLTTLPLLTAITLLPTASEIASALDQLTPSATNLAFPQTSYRVTQQFQDLWASQMEKGGVTCGQDSQLDDRNKLQLEDSSGCQPHERRSYLWGAGFGNWGKQGSVNGLEGYDSRILGAMLAYDFPLCFCEGLRAGVGVRYARSTLSGKIYDNDGDINSYQAMAYLNYAPGPWFANFALVYGLDDYSSSRHVAFPGFDGRSRASYDGDQYTVFGSTGYHFYVGDGRTVITPLASLQYTRVHVSGYTETGADAINLRVNAHNYDFLQSGLGVKVAHNIALSNSQVLRPEAHFNWLHSFNGETMQSTAAFTAGGPAFSTVGFTTQRNTFDVGAGIELISNKAWSIEGIYDYQWQNNKYSAHQAMIRFVLHL